jgi:hypothetical protein
MNNQQELLQTIFPNTHIIQMLALWSITFSNSTYIFIHLDHTTITYYKANQNRWAKPENIADPNFNPTKWAKQAKRYAIAGASVVPNNVPTK